MFNGASSIWQEVELLRLHHQISEAVDRAVAIFVNEQNNEERSKGISDVAEHLPNPYEDPPGIFRAFRRWHGSDLWMVLSNQADAEANALVTHRVTVGVYSDHPDRLVFIPDIVVTRPSGGRYILPPSERNLIESEELFLRVHKLEIAYYRSEATQRS